jgi:uncharacterized protein Yka (UPF0111/DUF47 family)
MPILIFSMRSLVGRGDQFFDLLEASAEEARRSALALAEFLRHPDNGSVMEEFDKHRREEKRLHEQISLLLCNTFITPLDREDIDALSGRLSRIPKVIKKFAERLVLLRAHIDVELFRRQAELLEQATQTLTRMVGMLRHHPQLDQIQAENDRLHRLEGDADKLILHLCDDLYSGRHPALQMIVLRDLHELLEKVIDRCRDAGNQVFQIVLKYS